MKYYLNIFFNEILIRMCIIENCNFVEKYGNYCYKHRRNYLIDSSERIILEHWTNKCSDYLKKDIIDNICDSCFGVCLHGELLADKRKEELFVLLANKINSLKSDLIKFINYLEIGRAHV